MLSKWDIRQSGSYSIATGIGLGFITHALCKIIAGRFDEAKPAVVALAVREVLRAKLLVAILAAADVVDVGAVWIEPLPEARRARLKTDSPPPAALLDRNGDVPT